MAKASKKPKFEFNIMGHKLVPEHVVISEKEKVEVLKKFNVTPDQLPKVLNTDPVASSIDAKPGQIIKVIRKSRTANEAEAYRFVIESNQK